MYHIIYNSLSKLLFTSFIIMLLSAVALAEQATSGYLGLGLGKLSAPVRAHLPDSVANNITKTQGLIVVGFADISPAADNGIKQYDVLLSYDGAPIEDPQAFIDKVHQDKPGRIVHIKLVRQGKLLELPIPLGKQLKVKHSSSLSPSPAVSSTVARATINPRSQAQNYRPRPSGYPPAVPYMNGRPYSQNFRPYAIPATPNTPAIRPLNIAGKPAYPMRKKPKVHAWGKKRNIWTDFYTGVTNDFWDKMINAPHDIGRMPGGWRAPALSTPDPVTVGDAVTNQMPPFVEEMGNMMDFSD